MGLASVSWEPQEAIESSRNAVSGQQDCTWGRRSGPDEAEAPPPNLNLIYSLSWKTDSMFKCSAETLIRLLLWGLISCRVWFIVHRLVFPLSHSNSGPTDSANETAESQPETVCCLHQRETPMIHQSFSVHEKLSGTSRCLPQTLHPAVQKKCSRKREERKCRITL